MKDQLQHWNNAHTKQWLGAYSDTQTEFAEEVNLLLDPESHVLELGCGEGNDSIFFADNGHSVFATDFSDVVIQQNKARWQKPTLQFSIQDMSKTWALDDNKFDAVYARLSLHYFPDSITKNIFKEIVRVLKPGGRLFFMCKEVHDPIYGKGEQIETDMFILDGHVRHFFSETYVSQLLEYTGLKQLSLSIGMEQIYDRQSAFIKVMAIKPAE